MHMAAPSSKSVYTTIVCQLHGKLYTLFHCSAAADTCALQAKLGGKVVYNWIVLRECMPAVCDPGYHVNDDYSDCVECDAGCPNNLCKPDETTTVCGTRQLPAFLPTVY